jgi:hypothetical protein
MERHIARVLVAVSVVCLVLDTAFTAAQTSLLSEQAWAGHAWPLIPIATLGCSVMGALILRRRPGHAVGRLLLLAGVCSLAGPAESYATWVLDGNGPGPQAAGHLAAWLSLVVTAPLGVTALVLIYLLAPGGRLRSRRWRWVVRTAVVGLGLWLSSVALLPPTAVTLTPSSEDRPFELLGVIGFLLVGASLVAAVASLVLSVRDAQGEARRQLLWVAASAALIAGALVPTLLLALAGSRSSALSVALFAGYATMPAFTAVAVLRHRLFDIDVIVSRALLVALATALVSAVYVLLVVSLGPLLTGDAGVPVTLLATAGVALAFQPLRRRVVRLADRLAYGAAAEPYDALAEFTRRLGDSPDPSTLLPAVAAAAGRAVGADRVTACFTVASGEDRTSTWPAGAPGRGGPRVELAVADGDARLGSLVVEMRPGRPLRPADLALLQDLADAAAVAFRGARLAAELSDRVDDLGRRATELEASRRRLLTAADVERDRLAQAIARDVVPHLAPMPEALAALARADEQAPAVEPLIDEAAAALDALRGITRGVYPAQLARSGLEPALRSSLGRGGAATLLVEHLRGVRLPPAVEAAAYVCVVEAERQMRAPVRVVLVLDAELERLRVRVTGGADGELPLAAMRDRVEAVGGAVALSGGGEEVVLEVLLPAGGAPSSAQATVPVAQAALSASGPSADLVR